MSAERPLALVTGGSVRVGRAVCLSLARAGCDVALTFRSSAREAVATVEGVRSLGAEGACLLLDLDSPEGVKDFAASFAGERGRLDILVHNASTYEPSPLELVTGDGALGDYRVNALAPLLLSAGLTPLLRESGLKGGGSIVAMCDIHAMGRPRRGFVAYEMSKAALAAMVAALARELAPGVRVNGVAPGVVAFPESGPDADPEMQRRYLSRVPLARAGTPEEAAEAVRWLALEATYTTGQIVRLDGGRWMT